VALESRILIEFVLDNHFVDRVKDASNQVGIGGVDVVNTEFSSSSKENMTKFVRQKSFCCLDIGTLAAAIWEVLLDRTHP
jgi:hypothetical protein